MGTALLETAVRTKGVYPQAPISDSRSGCKQQ